MRAMAHIQSEGIEEYRALPGLQADEVRPFLELQTQGEANTSTLVVARVAMRQL